MLNTPRAAAMVGGRMVDFIPAHREANDTPSAVEVSVTVPMSLEDITAALWLLIDGGMALDELDDPEFAHRMVVEMLMADGASALAEARHTIAELRPGTARANVAVALRERVATLYGRPAMATQRRTLVGV